MNEKLELTEEEVNVYSDDCGKIQVDCLKHSPESVLNKTLLFPSLIIRLNLENFMYTSSLLPT